MLTPPPHYPTTMKMAIHSPLSSCSMPAKLSSSLNQSTPSADLTVSFFTHFYHFSLFPHFSYFVLHTFHCSCSIDGSKYTPNLTWSNPHCPHLTPHAHRGTLSLNLHTPQKVRTTGKFSIFFFLFFSRSSQAPISPTPAYHTDSAHNFEPPPIPPPKEKWEPDATVARCRLCRDAYFGMVRRQRVLCVWVFVRYVDM